jgi:hypothetical protein
MSEEHQTPASRPLNPIAALTLVLVFPGRTFERLHDRPRWVLPVIFSIACALVSAIYAVKGGYMDSFIHSMSLRSGHDPATVRSGFIGSSILMAALGVPLVTLIETLFFRLAGRLMGGGARFGVVFSAVAHASVVSGVGALAMAGLMRITRSPTVGANLAVLLGSGANPFLWSLARQIDLFSLWFFVLLGIAAGPVFALDKRQARRTGILFAIIYVLVMSIGGTGSAGGLDDPYEDWVETETAAAVFYHEPDLGAEVLVPAGEAASVAVARASDILGQSLEGAVTPLRIDVYLYASLDSKKRTTDNGEVAHGVEWANTVHLVWTDGSELALTRETAKVMAAGVLGKAYNPLIHNGFAFYAGGEWGGMTLAEAALSLLDSGDLPSLAELTDPALYHRLSRQRSEPAAGSFFDFIAATRGEEMARDLYVGAVDLAGPVDAMIELKLGEPLDSLEGKWKDYIRTSRGAEDQLRTDGEAEDQLRTSGAVVE